MSEKIRKRRINTINVTDAGRDLAEESVDLSAAIKAFLRHCRVRNLTDTTTQFYRNGLSVFERLLRDQGVTRPVDITQEHVDECIIRRRDEKISEMTLNTNIRAWRAFWTYLVTEGFVEQNLRISPVKTAKKHVEIFSKQQLRRLFEMPDRSTFTGYRDYVIMLTLYETMIRVSELIGLKTSDIDWQRNLIRVFGKGRRERLVPFQDTLKKQLREYINIRGFLDHDYVFVNIDNEPIAKRTVQQEIKRYGDKAGISNVRVSPHTFRHTGAVHYLLNGGDLRSLQEILGHLDLKTTEIYLNLVASDISRQHRKFSPLERLHDDDDF